MELPRASFRLDPVSYKHYITFANKIKGFLNMAQVPLTLANWIRRKRNLLLGRWFGIRVQARPEPSKIGVVTSQIALCGLNVAMSENLLRQINSEL